MNAQPVIELRSVSKVYGDRHALRDVSLSLFPGEVLVVSGPSGAGKSTLARILVGLTLPTSGELLFRGENAGFSRFAGARQIVFQHPARSLSPRLTVRQIISEPAEIIGAYADASALAERVGLPPELLDRRPGRLSAGECQRAALARALSTDPQLLVLDEPDSSLDPIAAAAILRLVGEGLPNRCVVVFSHKPSILKKASRSLKLLPPEPI